MNRTPRVRMLLEQPAGKPKTKYIAYIRVSTEEQSVNGVSLEAQEDRVRAYVDFVEGELVDVVADRGASGKNLDRPGVQEVIDRLLAGEADALVVYAIDRLSRSTLDLLQTVDRLNRAGRGFVSVREQLDSSTPHGRFTLTILGGLAQMERELIAHRTREAMERCAREGRAISRGQYGWKRVGRKMEVDPQETEVLTAIRELRNRELTYRAIAERLNQEGVPPKRGQKWYASSVRSVLGDSN